MVTRLTLVISMMVFLIALVTDAMSGWSDDVAEIPWWLFVIAFTGPSVVTGLAVFVATLFRDRGRGR